MSHPPPGAGSVGFQGGRPRSSIEEGIIPPQNPDGGLFRWLFCGLVSLTTHAVTDDLTQGFIDHDVEGATDVESKQLDYAMPIWLQHRHGFHDVRLNVDVIRWPSWRASTATLSVLRHDRYISS